MAAHDTPTGGRLFPPGLTPEELLEHYLHFPVSPIKKEHQDELKTVRDNEILPHLDRSIAQYQRLWQQNFTKYPQLIEVTTENLERKKSALALEGIPHQVWEHFEELEKLQHKKKEVEQKLIPPLLPDHKEKTHDEHADEHYPLHRPQYLDHDPRYHTMINQRVAAWNKAHPEDLITAAVLLSHPDGAIYINPEVLTNIPSLETESQLQFKEAHGDDFIRYEQNEKSRIYRDADGNAAPDHDPKFKALQAEIQKQTDQTFQEQVAALQKKAHTQRPMWAPNKRQIEAAKRQELLAAFAAEHREKAEAYASNDQQLQAIVQQIRADEDERAAEQHDLARRTAEMMRSQRQYIASEQQIPSSDPRIQPQKINPIAIPQGGSNPNGINGGLGKMTPPTRIPGSGFSPSSALNGLGKRGANALGNIGSGALGNASGLLSKAPVLFNPTTLTILGAAIGIFILLVLIIALFAMFGSNLNNDNQSIPVTITKTGPPNVNFGENIKYDIFVSYPGSAIDVIVTDPIPENATFVEASGVYTCDGKKPSDVPDLTVCRSITWKFSEQNGVIPSGTPAPSTSPTPTPGSGFDYSKFQPYGFPPPQEPNPVILTGDTLSRWKTYSMNHAVKAAQAVGIDVGWIGMWGFIENSFSTYMDNCSDSDFNPNSYCYGWDGEWQVGLGVHPGYYGSLLKEAFQTMYGDTSNTKVQEVGQRVINDSTNPAKYVAGSTSTSRIPLVAINQPSTTFPNLSLDQIISDAQNGNQNARMYMGILIKDEAIGTYLTARNMKDKQSSGSNLASVMESWTADGLYYNRQKVINYIKAIYDAGISGEGGPVMGSKTFTLTVKPNDDNSYVINQASAQVIGGAGGTSTGDAGPTGYVPPSSSTCNGAYPYIGGSYPSNDPQLPPPYMNYGDPTCDFTKDKLHALLLKLDPDNADFWFNAIVPCESAYDPNNVTYWVGSVHTPDPYGAWGLYQQGSHKSGTPFIKFDEGSYNNSDKPEDRGDTNWQNQTINAVNYAKKYLIPNGTPLGAYWACAQ